MLIPLGTDAPVYYRPWATIGLIVVNVLVFVGFESTASEEVIDLLTLQFGHGIHPLQWLTNGFLHIGIVHLIGNMLFLWTFGMVVEGKVGWRRFLGLYLGIAMVQSATVQCCMLNADGGAALGASSAIMGIMAIACMWAPLNDVRCLLWVIIPFTWYLPLYVVITFYIGWDILLSARSGFTMSTETLHASGAALGVPVGLIMLTCGLVDCEGWDVLTVWAKGRPLTASERRSRQRGDRAHATVQGPVSTLPARGVDVALLRRETESSMRELMQLQLGGEALQALEVAQRSCGRWDLPADLLLDLARLRIARRDWNEAAHALREVMRIHAGHGSARQARIMLAGVYADHADRPAKALELLDGIRTDELDEAERHLVADVRERARHARAAGVLELEE